MKAQMTSTEKLENRMLEALKDIAFNLESAVMTKEQEKAFERNPECDKWRIYLSGLMIQARNQATNAIKHTEGSAE